MGISGLLPQLKSITRNKHISDYRGCTVGIDGYAWLHRGAFTCARELVEGIPTTRYIDFCMKLVNMLRANGVTPLVVFDGAQLPAKKHTETERHRSREENRERAAAHARSGNAAAAAECYQKAVDITPLVAKGLIDTLAAERVAFLVAPYEADAQLAYMALKGIIHAVMTEDSDLLAYGCPRVLYKFDRGSGSVQEVCSADFPLNADLNLVGMGLDLFQEMCVMAGCDFLPSLPNVGVKKAHAAIKRFRSFMRACKNFRYEGGSVTVPRGYEEGFQRALWTFRHQRVYCPEGRRLVHVNPVPEGGLVPATGLRLPVLVPRQPQEAPPGVDIAGPPAAAAAAAAAGGAADSDACPLDFLGPPIPADIACGIAEGRLDPMTWKEFPPRPVAPVAASQQNYQQGGQAGRGRGAGEQTGPVSGSGRSGGKGTGGMSMGQQGGSGSARDPALSGPPGPLRPITNFFGKLTDGGNMHRSDPAASKPFKPPGQAPSGSGSRPATQSRSQSQQQPTGPTSAAERRSDLFISQEEVTSPPPPQKALAPAGPVRSRFFGGGGAAPPPARGDTRRPGQEGPSQPPSPRDGREGEGIEDSGEDEAAVARPRGGRGASDPDAVAAAARDALTRALGRPPAANPLPLGLGRIAPAPLGRTGLAASRPRSGGLGAAADKQGSQPAQPAPRLAMFMFNGPGASSRPHTAAAASQPSSQALDPSPPSNIHEDIYSGLGDESAEEDQPRDADPDQDPEDGSPSPPPYQRGAGQKTGLTGPTQRRKTGSGGDSSTGMLPPGALSLDHIPGYVALAKQSLDRGLARALAGAGAARATSAQGMYGGEEGMDEAGGEAEDSEEEVSPPKRLKTDDRVRRPFQAPRAKGAASLQQFAFGSAGGKSQSQASSGRPKGGSGQLGGRFFGGPRGRR